MATASKVSNKKRSLKSAKSRYIGRPAGLIQERVQAVGPTHFGIISVDCAKRRSKWMLCDFYGKVLIATRRDSLLCQRFKRRIRQCGALELRMSTRVARLIHKR